MHFKSIFPNPGIWLCARERFRGQPSFSVLHVWLQVFYGSWLRGQWLNRNPMEWQTHMNVSVVQRKKVASWGPLWIEARFPWLPFGSSARWDLPCNQLNFQRNKANQSQQNVSLYVYRKARDKSWLHCDIHRTHIAPQSVTVSALTWRYYLHS